MLQLIETINHLAEYKSPHRLERRERKKKDIIISRPFAHLLLASTEKKNSIWCCVVCAFFPLLLSFSFAVFLPFHIRSARPFSSFELLSTFVLCYVRCSTKATAYWTNKICKTKKGEIDRAREKKRKDHFMAVLFGPFSRVLRNIITWLVDPASIHLL